MDTTAREFVGNVQREAALAAIADIMVGNIDALSLTRRYVPEAEEVLSKQQVEQIVRKILKADLEDRVLQILKQELKSQNFEGIVTGVTSRALARFFEIMFTRKSTWQNQLKGKL